MSDPLKETSVERLEGAAEWHRFKAKAYVGVKPGASANHALAVVALEAIAEARRTKGFSCDCGISEDLEARLFSWVPERK